MRTHSLLRPLLVCLVALPFVGGAGCPTGPGDDGGTDPEPGDFNIDGVGYTADLENSKLIVFLQKVSSAGICAPTHGHAVEATSFRLDGELNTDSPGDGTLTLTVPATLLAADLPENRELYDELRDEFLSDADRNRIQDGMIPEVADSDSPNLVFDFSNLSSLEAGTGLTFDAVATIKGVTQSFTFTFDLAIDGTTYTLTNGTGVISRENFGVLTSNPFGGCLSDDMRLDLRTLTLVPGEADAIDAGAVFEQTCFPYDGACVDDGSPAWNDEMFDILGRRCLGCHEADSDYPLAAYDDWRCDSPTEAGRPRFEAAHELMQLPTDDSVHMPPVNSATQLPQAEIDLVYAWFEAGAPPACAAPAPVGFTAVPRNMECGATVGFAEDVAPMIDNNLCVLCHAGDNPDVPLINNTYASGTPDSDHPFYAGLSIWEASVERIRDGTMPPLEGFGAWVPTNGTLEADLAILDEWVADGYPATRCQ